MPANIDELNITISADATKAMEEIKRLADQLKKLGGKYPGFARALKELDSTEKSAKKSANSAKKAAKDVGDAAKQAGAAAKKATGDMSKGMDSAAKAAQKAQKSMSNLGKGMPKIEFDFKGIDATKDQIKAAMKEAQGELPRLVAEYGAQDAVNIAKNRARVMAQQLSEGLRTLSASNANGRTKADIERDAQKQAEWQAKANERQAEKFRAREEKYQRMMSSWRSQNGGASVQTNSQVPQISRTAEALNKLKVVAGGVRKALSPANLSPYNMSKGIVSGVGIAIGAFRRLTGTIPNVNYAISKGLVSGVGKLGGVMGRAGSGVLSFVGTLAKIHAAGTAAVTLGVLARMTRTVTSGFKNLAKAAGSVPFKIFSAGAKVATGAVSRLKEAFKNVGKSSDGSSKALRNIQRATLSAVVGVRSVFSLIRRIRKSIGESLEDLAKYSSDVDKTIGGLKGSLNQLSDSFATAFEPILTAVAPYIRQLIDWVISGINAVNQFFSALSGRSTWTKATFHMESIASGANDAASGTNAANDAAKEYQRTLMGFDKINKLESPFDSGSGGGSGGSGGAGGGDATGGTFTTEEISTGVKDFVTMVKEAWQNADFTDVGRVIGEKLADALNKIPWDKIKATASRFGTSFATLINGLVSVTELATALGTTIGESINTIFTGANAFVSNLNFGAVGAFFAEVMNSGIATVDWDLIADTLSKAANGVFNLAGTWANRFNFGALGTNIGSTITSALEKIEWEDAEAACVSIGDGIATALNGAFEQKPLTAVGDAIAGALSAVFSGVNSFVSKVEYGTVGEDLADALDAIVAKKSLWKGVASTLSTTANGVFTLAATWADKFDFDALGTEVGNTITSTLSGLEWEDAKTACKNLGKGVADALNAAVEEKPLTAVANAVGNAINAAIAGLDDFLTETSWKAVGQEIADSINEFFSTFDFTKAGVTVGNAMNSLLTLFNNAVKNVSWTEVGSKVMSAIKGFFSTFEWSGISGALFNIANALRDLFTGAISEVEWENVPDAIINAIKSLIQGVDFKAQAESIGRFMGALVAAGLNLGEAIYNKLVDTGANIAEYFGKFIAEAGYDQDESLLHNAGAIALGILNGVANGFAEIGKWIKENLFDPFVKGFKEQFGIVGGDSVIGAIAQFGYDIANGILNGIKKTFDNIKQWIDLNVAIPLERAFYEAIPDWFADAFGIDKEVKLKFLAEKEAGYQAAVDEYVGTNDKGAEVYLSADENPTFRDAIRTYNSAQSGEVTKDVNVEKGPNWNPEAYSAANHEPGEKTEATLEQNVVQGPSWFGDAVAAMKKLGGKVVNTLEENVVKGSVWNSDAASAMNRVPGEKISNTLEQNVSKGPTWYGDAVVAMKKAGGTIVNTLKQNLAKGNTWSPEAYTAANRVPGETRTSTLKQNVTKGTSWFADAVTLAKKVGGTVTNTLQQNLQKGNTWSAEAYSAANREPGETRTSTLKQNLTKGGTWSSEAYYAIYRPSGNRTSTLIQNLTKGTGKNWDADAEKVVKVPAHSTSTRTMAAKKDSSLNDGVVKDFITLSGKSTLTTTMNVARQKGWSKDETWQDFTNGGKGKPNPSADMSIGRKKKWSGTGEKWQDFLNDGVGKPNPVATMDIGRTKKWKGSGETWQDFLNDGAGKPNPTADMSIARTKKWANTGEKWQDFLNGGAGKPNPSADMSIDRTKKWKGSSETWQDFLNGGAGKANPSANMNIGRNKNWTLGWQDWINGGTGKKKPNADMNVSRNKNWSGTWQDWINTKSGNKPSAEMNISRLKNWALGWQDWVNGGSGKSKPSANMNIDRKKNWSGTWQAWVNGGANKSNPEVNMDVNGKLTDKSKKSMGQSVIDWAIDHLPDWLKKALGREGGGAFYGGSWHSISQFAAGGTPTHGSMFVAGEAGAEMVGHINGRTEVLNQSQMASTMYAAVYGAMMAAIANSPSGAVNVYLQGDAKGLFKAVQSQANQYTQMTGQPAFNL